MSTEEIRTDFETAPTPADPAVPRPRLRGLVTTAQAKTAAVASQGRAAVVPKARRAAQQIGDSRVPAVAGALVAAAAATVLIVRRRRAVKARAARNRWLPVRR